MNKLNTFLAVGALLVSLGEAKAQAIDEVLRNIERNNKELQASAKDAEAARMEVQTQNNLEDPSVEYSPFYTKGISGMSSSELVVSQSFDFPTLYAARHSSGKLQKEVVDRQYQVERRELLLSAKNLCLDMIMLNKQQAMLSLRKKNAGDLLTLFDERLKQGDAGVLDINKIKMELMNVQTEVAQNNAAHRTALQKLLAMNGNLPIEFSASEYPQAKAPVGYDELYDEVVATDATLQMADASARAAEKNVSVQRQNWLPKLEVGYRRNTSIDEKSNGFLIGGSLPLFSNRKKNKIARAQAVSARLRLDDVRLQTEADVQSRYNELRQLDEAMRAYDVTLMTNTLSLLKEAVTEGQISVIDYYTEADNVYNKLMAYYEVENRYQKLLAEIYKNRL